jgi:hypothetical protein
MKLKPLWNVVFSGRYDLPAPDQPDLVAAELKTLAGPHGFFHACAKFFRVSEIHNVQIQENLPGRFAFYHFSEIFHKFSPTIPRAVLIGQWDIDLINGVYYVTERQAYDGKLGRLPARDRYNGYCLPMSMNISFILRHAMEQTPKYYMLRAPSAYDDPETSQIQVLFGFMLKGSEEHQYFRSPVYAVRVPKDQRVARNILRCEAIPRHVLEELEALVARTVYTASSGSF